MIYIKEPGILKLCPFWQPFCWKKYRFILISIFLQRKLFSSRQCIHYSILNLNNIFCSRQCIYCNILNLKNLFRPLFQSPIIQGMCLVKVSWHFFMLYAFLHWNRSRMILPNYGNVSGSKIADSYLFPHAEFRNHASCEATPNIILVWRWGIRISYGPDNLLPPNHPDDCYLCLTLPRIVNEKKRDNSISKSSISTYSDSSSVPTPPQNIQLEGEN